MFSEEVKDENGNVHTVYADSKEELARAVEARKEVKATTYPNINVPLPKGHDLLEVDEALNTKVVDGTGAHNSPRDAVRDDGSFEGDPDVPMVGADEAPFKVHGTGEPANADGERVKENRADSDVVSNNVKNDDRKAEQSDDDSNKEQSQAERVNADQNDEQRREAEANKAEANRETPENDSQVHAA